MTRSKALAVAFAAAVGMWPAAHSSLISPALSAADTNAYFDALVSSPAFWKGYSLRPRPGATKDSPYYSNQLEGTRAGGYGSNGAKYVTYDSAMDAAKVSIPAFTNPGESLFLGTNMSSSDTKVYPATWTSSLGVVGRQVKIDKEVMLVTAVDAKTVSPRGVAVSRGQYGTAAASHAAGAPVGLGVNSLPSQVRLPLRTEDGNTYVFTWDVMYTSSYVGTGLKGNKTFQLSSGDDNVWFEVKTRMDGGSQVSKPADFNKAVHVGGVDVRSYNRPGGNANWLLTDGTYLGPGIIGNQPINPMQATFILHPNRWIRYWVVVEQRLNDYDYVDLWAADEVQNPTLIYKRIPASTFNDGPHSIRSFWLEFNDSDSKLPLERTTDFRDMVAYVRNFAAMRNISDVKPLLQRPVPGVLPGDTKPVLGAPRNIRIVQP